MFAAQQNPPAPPPRQETAQQPDDPDAHSVDVTRVNMLFTVMDKKGRFVTDLGKDDFEIIESKKQQVIQEFSAETDLPLRLGILIDTSNSIRDRFKFEQEAASEFVAQRDALQPGQSDGGEFRYRPPSWSPT